MAWNWNSHHRYSLTNDADWWNFLFSQMTHVYKLQNHLRWDLQKLKAYFINFFCQMEIMESFKWKLIGPRNSVFFSANCLGLMANEVVPYPWVLPHNNYLGSPEKLRKISGSATINCFPAFLHYAHMLYANLYVKFKKQKIITSQLWIKSQKLTLEMDTGYFGQGHIKNLWWNRENLLRKTRLLCLKLMLEKLNKKYRKIRSVKLLIFLSSVC